MFFSWHAVSGFPVKAASPLIPRANSAYPAVKTFTLLLFLFELFQLPNVFLRHVLQVHGRVDRVIHLQPARRAHPLEPLIWKNTADISMSEAADNETGKKLIVLSCNVEGVEIRYSLEGSNLPDATVYDKPIPVPEGEHILRAQAFAIREEDEDYLQAVPFERRVGMTVSGSRAVVEKGRKVFIRGTKSGCYDLGSTRAESLRTLACLGRHGATLRPQIEIQPRDTGNSYVMLSLSGDGAPFLSADNVSELVNSICDKIYGSLDLVDVHIKAPDIKFEDGADFEAFAEEVQRPIDDFDYYQK